MVCVVVVGLEEGAYSESELLLVKRTYVRP